MKTILVATDFSPHSRDALKGAVDLLRETQEPSKILLLNTYLVDLNQDPSTLIQRNDELKKQSRNNLEIEKSFALENVRNPLINIETLSHMGSLSNVITNLLRVEKYDLVVMAKQGCHNVEYFEELLKKYNCPFLTLAGPA